MSSSASLAAILQHDGIGLDPAAIARAPIGSHVRLRGASAPIVTATAAPLDALLHPGVPLRLENFTYAFDDGGPAVVWVTSSTARPFATTAVIDGTVIAHGYTHEALARLLIVVRADSWTRPILFG